MTEPTHGERLAEELFGPGGRLAKSLPEYEHRPSQVEMAAAVADVLQEGGKLLVEAGTGTGKTLAYLGPAVLLGRRVVISTGTRNLQDQILHKDLRILEKALGHTFRVCVLKGRHNYLCPRRYRSFLEEPALRSREDAALFDKVRDWAEKTATGEIGEARGVPEDYAVWRDLCCSAEVCNPGLCAEFGEPFIQRARQRAAASDVVVVNHHLFFSDLNLRLHGGDGFSGGILPTYAAAVFDEAHNLEDVATDYFGTTVSRGRIEDLARDALREAAGKGEDDVTNALAEVAKSSDAFFSALPGTGPLFREAGKGRPGGRKGRTEEKAPARAREESGERRRLRPEDVTRVLSEAANALTARLKALARAADSARTEGLKTISRRAQEIASQIDFILRMEDSAYISWVQTRGRGVAVTASPIDVSGVLREELFDRVQGVVLTSATLSSGESFDFIRGRLGLDGAGEILLPSPFDHARQAALFVPRISSPPNTREWIDAICPHIESLLALCEGRAFVLFTSYRNLRTVHGRLKDRITHRVLIQGEAPRALLLDEFRRDRTSVLFATASFWQGVDVQGDALSCVIIDKLPFPSPGDPLVEARSEAIAAEGENAFLTYQVPRAVLALKQGLGRLIRSREDRGLLAVLDSRLHTRPYGRTFLEGLPPWPLVEEEKDLVEAADRLFGEGPRKR
ncbi:MAG: ATP-dependent DNA helicase [Nitrospinota bacterium]|nr:ATP-dependent DNA helicase [Nitrospinota bacterium]HJM42018.1 ATP-dependent DNA helicase [Nitrospinota bacterium]